MDHSHIGPPHEGGLKPYGFLALLVVAASGGGGLIGYGSGILALIADAVHTLGDGLAIGLVALFLAAHHLLSTKWNSRLETSIRIAIGLLIIGAGVHTGLESLERWRQPNEISGPIMVGTAILCAALNRAMLLALGSCPCGMDKHLRAHVRSDIWISVGVAMSGTLVLLTRLWWIEPATSSAISLLVIWLGVQVVLNLHKDKETN